MTRDLGRTTSCSDPAEVDLPVLTEHEWHRCREQAADRRGGRAGAGQGCVDDGARQPRPHEGIVEIRAVVQRRLDEDDVHVALPGGRPGGVLAVVPLHERDRTATLTGRRGAGGRRQPEEVGPHGWRRASPAARHTVPAGRTTSTRPSV